MKILLSSVCLETGTDIQLALYYLKGFILKSRPGRQVSIRVFGEYQDIAGITKRILDFKPQLVGFSCYLWNIEKILKVCRRLKKISPRLKIVLGGPEVSPRAQELLAQEKALDVVVRGEGEQSFTEVISRLGRSKTADLSGIKGISFRNGTRIIHNPDRPLLSNINRIPSPYLSGLVNLKHRNIVDVPLETMRGCSFRCHYCYYHKNFPKARNFSLKRIAKELKLILSHKPHEVYLMDPTFNSNPQRAKKVLKLFIKYNRGAVLHVELKAELIDREMAQLLAKANARNIEIGIQSTNPKTLKAVRRGFNKKKFARGIRYLNEFKLYYEIQLIDALPFQSYDSLLESLDWLYSLRPVKVEIFRLNLLPGTTLRDKAAAFGITYDHCAPYAAYKSSCMSAAELKDIEKLSFAMERLYDSQVFQKTLFAFMAKAEVKISTILRDWVAWESGFKKRPADYPEFLNRKSPEFLEYLCRKHSKAYLYKELLPGLLESQGFAAMR